MTSRDFCFWLQGYLEIANTDKTYEGKPLALSSAQVEIVQQHLALVFVHEIDPSMGGQSHQEKLNKVHDASLIMRC